MSLRLFGLVVCVTAFAALAEAQQYKAPFASDGHPDLQGFWANNNATPLQRPKELADHPVLTDAEVKAMRQKGEEMFTGKADAAFGDQLFLTVWANVKGLKVGFKSTDGETGDYSSEWNDHRVWDNRTSLITDPIDGRIPPLTARAKNVQEETEDSPAAARSWARGSVFRRTVHHSWLASGRGRIPELFPDRADACGCHDDDGNVSRCARHQG